MRLQFYQKSRAKKKSHSDTKHVLPPFAREQAAEQTLHFAEEWVWGRHPGG
jgi:hypothetical protein